MLDFFTESDWGIHFIILIKITSYSLFLKMNCLHVLEQQSWYHPNYVVCSDLELLHFKIEQNTKIFLNERWFTRLIHNRYSIGRRFCGPSSFIPFPSLFMWNNPILTFEDPPILRPMNEDFVNTVYLAPADLRQALKYFPDIINVTDSVCILYVVKRLVVLTLFFITTNSEAGFYGIDESRTTRNAV